MVQGANGNLKKGHQSGRVRRLKRRRWLLLIDLPDRDAAAKWIMANQFGKLNLQSAGWHFRLLEPALRTF
jgi:hypothetical protein